MVGFGKEVGLMLDGLHCLLKPGQRSTCSYHKNEDIWLEDFPYSAEELAFKEMSACIGSFCCWFMLHTIKCCSIQSKLRPEVTGFCTPGFTGTSQRFVMPWF